MRKIHTKKLIVEAIKHWESVLTRIDESKNSLLSGIEQIYGTSVYDAGNLFDANNALRTFDLLNANIFDSCLKPLTIEFMSTGLLLSLFDKYSNPQKARDLYAVYFPISDWNYIIKNQFKDIKLFDEHLVINVSQGNINSAFAISTICHEMIHYYDTFYGDILKIAYDCHLKKQPYDEHTTKVFQQITNEANNMGLTIIPNGNDVPIDELNLLSAYRLKKQLNEDEYYDLMFKALSNYKTNVFDKISIDDSGNLGAIAF